MANLSIPPLPPLVESLIDQATDFASSIASSAIPVAQAILAQSPKLQANAHEAFSATRNIVDIVQAHCDPLSGPGDMVPIIEGVARDCIQDPELRTETRRLSNAAQQAAINAFEMVQDEHAILRIAVNALAPKAGRSSPITLEIEGALEDASKLMTQEICTSFNFWNNELFSWQERLQLFQPRIDGKWNPVSLLAPFFVLKSTWENWKAKSISEKLIWVFPDLLVAISAFALCIVVAFGAYLCATKKSFQESDIGFMKVPHIALKMLWKGCPDRVIKREIVARFSPVLEPLMPQMPPEIRRFLFGEAQKGEFGDFEMTPLPSPSEPN